MERERESGKNCCPIHFDIRFLCGSLSSLFPSQVPSSFLVTSFGSASFLSITDLSAQSINRDPNLHPPDQYSWWARLFPRNLYSSLRFSRSRIILTLLEERNRAMHSSGCWFHFEHGPSLSAKRRKWIGARSSSSPFLSFCPFILKISIKPSFEGGLDYQYAGTWSIGSCVHSLLLAVRQNVSCSLQRSAKVGAPALVNFITAVAYHSCPSLPAAFTQPGASTLADLCNVIYMELKSKVPCM